MNGFGSNLAKCVWFDAGVEGSLSWQCNKSSLVYFLAQFSVLIFAVEISLVLLLFTSLNFVGSRVYFVFFIEKGTSRIFINLYILGTQNEKDIFYGTFSTEAKLY